MAEYQNSPAPDYSEKPAVLPAKRTLASKERLKEAPLMALAFLPAMRGFVAESGIGHR